MGNKSSKKKQSDMTQIIMQMKMSAKRFEREAIKASKEKAKNLKKAEKALLKGDEEGAKLYTANAQNNINDYRKYLHMSSKLDAMTSKMKGCYSSTRTISHVSNNVTPIMVQQADQMDIKNLVQNFDQFQDAFDKMQVNTNIMNQNFNMLNSEGNIVQDTDNLYQQVKNKVQFDVNRNDSHKSQLRRTNSLKDINDDEFTKYINELKKVEIVNIESFGQPQETILQFLREFGSRVSQQSSKLFLLAQEKKTGGIKLIFLSASTNDIKYIGIESKNSQEQNQSKIQTYIESNSLQTAANAIGINPNSVKLNEEERVNYTNLLVNSFACSVKQPQLQFNQVQASSVQQSQRLQNQNVQNQTQNSDIQNTIQYQNSNNPNRIQIRLPDYTSLISQAYSQDLLYPPEEKVTSQMIEINVNGKQYRVDCNKLNLPIDFLVNNQNVMIQANDEQNETRAALIQAYNQCAQLYEDKQTLTNQEGNMEFDLYRINNPSSTQNQQGSVTNIYRYQGNAEPLVPNGSGPSLIDINRTNEIVTTVTKQEVQQPAQNQQTIQLSNFSLENFDDLLNQLETNQEGLDVFSLQADRTSSNSQQEFESVLREQSVQPQNQVQNTRVLTINSDQQSRLLESSSQNRQQQSQQGQSQQQNTQTQQSQGSQNMLNNQQQVQNTNTLSQRQQQQIQDQILRLSESVTEDDSQTIDEFEQQLSQILNNENNQVQFISKNY